MGSGWTHVVGHSQKRVIFQNMCDSGIQYNTKQPNYLLI